jgi:hypothetical protein
MSGWARSARRLASAATIALALLAAGVVVPTPGQPALGHPVGGGWGQSGAARSGFGYAPPPGGHARGREGKGRAPGGPVLGVVGYKPAVLAWLDPLTLRPLPGPRLRLRYGISGYGWSPDRSTLVLGDVDDDKLHLVDPVRLRRRGTVDFGIVAAAPQSFAWLGPRRLAAVAGSSDDGSTLVMVDPLARRVLTRRRLAPGVLTAAAGDRLVLLSTALDQIGPARLLVMDDQGRVRGVELPETSVGFQPPPDWDQPGAYGVSRGAALAVDPEGGRAFLVTAGTTVTEVDLDSLQVTTRRLRQPVSLLRRLAHWLVPPAQAKLNAGTWRDACWLGEGLLAVWGSETRVHGLAPGSPPPEERASGLKLVDTWTWTVRPLDPAAAAASWQEGRLLAFGATWDYEADDWAGVGLTVYGPGGRPPRRLLGDQVVMEAQLNGDLAYAGVHTGAELFGRVVVSVRSGRVLWSSPDPPPYLLLADHGERDRPC